MEKKKKKQQTTKKNCDFAMWQIILAVFVFLILLLGTLIIGERLIHQNELSDLKAKAEDLSKEVISYCRKEKHPTTSFAIKKYDFDYDGLEIRSTLPEGGQIRLNSSCDIAMAIYVDRNCAIKNFDDNDFRVFRVDRMIDCSLDEETITLCDYDCDIFGDILPKFLAKIFPEGVKQAQHLPTLDSDSEVKARFESSDDFDILLDYNVRNLEGFYVEYDEQTALLLQGPFDFFPGQLVNKIAKDREVLMILFEETTEVIRGDEYIWVFLLENNQIKCYRERLSSE